MVARAGILRPYPAIILAFRERWQLSEGEKPEGEIKKRPKVTASPWGFTQSRQAAAGDGTPTVADPDLYPARGR